MPKPESAELVDESPEQWREIAGYEGKYDVSSHGRVRSLRLRSGRLAPEPRLLKPFANPNGYLGVDLLGVVRRIHILVCEAFSGPRPAGMECAHLNGINTDNRAVNLKWVTRKENHNHMIAHGTRIRGTRKKLAKLTDAGVQEMRQLAAAGVPVSDLTARFGVNFGRVYAVLRGDAWGHVPVSQEEVIATLSRDLTASQQRCAQMEKLTICGCGDHFTEHDPGTCGNCVAALRAALQVKPHDQQERAK